VKGLAEGECKIEWIDDALARPKGDPAPDLNAFPTQPHEVEQGECLETIAHRASLPWKAIWEHPSNAEIKDRRKNPNVLLPEDILNIPQAKPKPLPAQTGKTHTFELSHSAATKLDVILTYANKPLGDQTCLVKVPGMEDLRTKTKPNGRLIVDLPANAEVVTVQMANSQQTFRFNLGHVDPIDTVSGVQGRLLALGYSCGNDDDDDDLGLATRQAIFRFQRDNGLKPTGELDGTFKSKLKEIFGA
jgi:hypothetical protein